MNRICRDFNERGLPTSGGRKWAVGNLQRALTSDRVLGYEVRERWETDDRGKRQRLYSTTLDDEGNPKRRADPVLPEALVQQLRKVLSGRRLNGRQAGARSRGALLLGIVRCATGHDEPLEMWQQHSGDAGRRRHYYRCRSNHSITTALKPCGAPALRMAEMDELAERWVLAMLGSTILTRRVWDAGTTHSEELDGLRSRLAMLGDDRDAGLFDTPAGQGDYRRRYGRISQQIADLESLPQRPPKWVEIPAGETFRDAWQRSDIVQQNALLRQSGIQFWTFGSIERTAPVWIDHETGEAWTVLSIGNGSAFLSGLAMSTADRLRHLAQSQVRTAMQETGGNADQDPEWEQTLAWLYSDEQIRRMWVRARTLDPTPPGRRSGRARRGTKGGRMTDHCQAGSRFAC
ncbi:recombinase family protein [Cellulosimicrobium cellulans]|uniref:recombinase family protein n=1 Tax=Cellulosimicrobium cellulans TaxID=1710 RepID=UPI001EDA9727|nr:recombinase family protein [Cellulosimicrobium cellulans]UKJ62218.1 recombinase family protein [Cellulosimicrobium cellulans]